MEKAPDTFLSHAMEANEMEPWTRDERSQAWPELERGHHEMGGPVAVRGFEFEHDRTSTCALKPFGGKCCDQSQEHCLEAPLCRES